MSKPVAVLHLDTQAWGPASCDKCDVGAEKVILMDNATFLCPECGTRIQGGVFDEMSEFFTSAEPVKPGEFKGLGNRKGHGNG